jgi:2-keto-4-pentenoate hydratase/2-oxohepta-3-ene-1,7-dioic acid hydratase in catechol pathway
MKLTCFYQKGKIHVGVVLPCGGILDATAAGVGGSLMAIIRDWALYRPQLVRLWRDETLPVLRPEQLSFAPPADDRSKLICIGLNYRDHIEETRGRLESTERAPYPVVFSKFSDALTGHKQEIFLPTHLEESFDYEAELVVVIGKAGSEIAEEDAMDHVFGYTCGNDLTIRDAQKRTSQWLIGKSYPGFAPVGPYIVTADALDPFDLEITCRRGDKVVQRASTADMIFKLPELISHVSRYIPLRPGDLLFTGTPSGVILGYPKDERRWLTPGETVTVAIEGIGELTNTLIGPQGNS